MFNTSSQTLEGPVNKRDSTLEEQRGDMQKTRKLLAPLGWNRQAHTCCCVAKVTACDDFKICVNVGPPPTSGRSLTLP